MRVAPMTSRFLDACRRRPTDVRPVWFMRQAGRYLKQYRQIREKHGILEICKRPDLAATVTLQPIEVLEIGFVGAPFTMASYMIEGGATRNFVRTKKLMYSDETLWRRLMGKIVDVLAPFAHSQVTAGARAIQVFDSWVGALGSDDYVRYAAPYSRALIAVSYTHLRAHETD